MFVMFRRLKDTNLTAAEEFLLSDLFDESDYLSVQKFFDNAINPCMPSTYRFVTVLVNHLVQLHSEIQVEYHKYQVIKSYMIISTLKLLNKLHMQHGVIGLR